MDPRQPSRHLPHVPVLQLRRGHGLCEPGGEIAESEGHHPDLLVAWGRVEVKTWTHKIDGLTESDFILAAKIDRLARGD